MLNLLTITASLLALVLVTVGAGWTNAARVLPDVAIAATVFAAARRDTSAALMTALVVGWCAAVLVGEARGAYLLSLLPVVAVTRLASHRLPVDGVWAGATWSVFSVMLAAFTFAVLTSITGLQAGVWSGLVRSAPAVALATGLFALPFFGMLQLVEPLLRERQERSTLLR